MRVERLNRLIAYQPAWVLGVVLALGLGSGLVLVDVTTPALRLKIETAVEKILPTRGPDRDRYQGLRDRFGNEARWQKSIVVDRTKPEITLVGEEQRGIGNQELRFESNEELESLTSFGKTVIVRGKTARVEVDLKT